MNSSSSATSGGKGFIVTRPLTGSLVHYVTSNEVEHTGILGFDYINFTDPDLKGKFGVYEIFSDQQIRDSGFKLLHHVEHDEEEIIELDELEVLDSYDGYGLSIHDALTSLLHILTSELEVTQLQAITDFIGRYLTMTLKG